MNTIRAMKRFFLIFLLFALPLQISWAAMAAYCQHETGIASNHFGHHAHQHQTQKDSETKKESPSSIDRDCAYCHLTHVGYFSFVSNLPSVSPPSVHDVDHDYGFTLMLPDRPERPKWILAV